MADTRRAVAGLLLPFLLGATAAAPATQALASSNGVSAMPLVSAALVPRYGALWGAWAAPGGASAVASFEATIKRRLDIVHQYHAWNEVWPTSTEYGWATGGRIIFGNISARTTSSGVLNWSSIANGSQDAAIHAMASRLKAFAHQVFVSFDQEPESRLSSFTAADYIAASRHIHALFAADGAGNVVWVWNVAGSTSSSDLAKYKSLYPGDSYVDWVAWDPYNWNTCIHPYGWRTFDQTVAGFYNWLAGGHLTAGAASKPYMLAEYGSVEAGAGAKGKWFTGEASTLPNRPRIKAVVYFNENKDCNWPITTSSSSVAAFRSAGLTCWVNRAQPWAPGPVTAAAGSGDATVRWGTAASVCPISTYTILVSPGGKLVTVSGAVRTATVKGLANGTKYTFSIRATSVNGSSTYSAPSAAVTPTGVLGSPAATPSSSPSRMPGTTPAANPTEVRSTPVAGVVQGADWLTTWLEAHVIVLPMILAVLIAFGLATQYLFTRRRRA
jgi:hypothetical protein